MYVHFAKKFLEAVSSHGFEDRVQYFEYLREGWTFHGKGLWYYLPGEQLPSLSLVGSSNYGKVDYLQQLLSRSCCEGHIIVVCPNKKINFRSTGKLA